MSERDKLSPAQWTLLQEVGNGIRTTCVDSYKPMKALVRLGLMRAEEGRYALRLSVTDSGQAMLDGESK